MYTSPVQRANNGSAPLPLPSGQEAVIMHHRVSVLNDIEARRASVDVRRQSSEVSGRVGVDLRRRQSSMLPAYSGMASWPVVDEEAAVVPDLCQSPVPVQASSRPSTPRLVQEPQRSSQSLPELKQPASYQCHTPCGTAPSSRSPFAHAQLQHGPTKLQFGGVTKAAMLVVMLVVCCLGVYSASQTTSFGHVVRRQLAVSVISVKQQQPFSIAEASKQQAAAAQRSTKGQCRQGFYSSQAGCTECPGGLTTKAPGAEAVTSCVAPAGSYLAGTAASPRAKLCPKGSWSPAFNRLMSCLKCAKGQTTRKTGSTSKLACISRSSSAGRPYVDTPVGGEQHSSSPSPVPTAADSPSPSPNIEIPIDSEGLDPPLIEDPPLPPVYLDSPSPDVPDVTATQLQPEALASSPSPSPDSSPSPSPRIIDLSSIQVVAQPIGLDDP